MARRAKAAKMAELPKASQPEELSQKAKTLADEITILIWHHVFNGGVTVGDVLRALEINRYEITEHFIKDHPELIWQLPHK